MPRIISPSVALLLVLIVGQNHFVVCYIRSLFPTTSRTRRDVFFPLHSSPNIFRGRTFTGRDDDDDKTNKEKKRKNKNKIEFVNFWGTKISSIGENDTEMTDPRHVPCVPTLDVRDGPLPRGAYVLEGNQEFDSKSTCRITIDVKTGKIESADDANAIIRRLQSCIDAGLDTFRLHDQTAMSLAIIRRMNENTPSYINKHWSVGLKMHSISTDANTLSTKSDLRQTVLGLVEQTGGDALDSLTVDCGRFPSKKPLLSDEVVLETFEHLVDLQREGWIRSIGVRGFESEKLRRDVMNYFGDHIDFEEQEGNLLLPPPDLYKPQKNLHMSNALAGGLLTDLYNNDRRRRKIDAPSGPQSLLTRDNMQLLKEWAKRRETQQTTTLSSGPILKQYQNDVVGQLSWIAMKHDVSISAVALRWTLECSTGEGPVVSSALAEIDFDDPRGDFPQKLIELRQVFRFQLDEEDREILSEISPLQIEEKQDFGEEGFPDIDFNNPRLWL